MAKLNKAKFPGWRYHPDTGQGQIFGSAEEVPHGWVDHFVDTDAERKPARPVRPVSDEHVHEPPAGERTDELDVVAELVHNHSQKELVDKLEAMNEERGLDEQIEFLGTWPKKKLAETIVDNGGGVLGEAERAGEAEEAEDEEAGETEEA